VAAELAAAGLRRVNISLDTLRPDRFREITRRGRLEDALAGIEAARQAGLAPLKINTVVIRGVNDDEVVDLARRALAEVWHLRFIEWMPVGSGDFVEEDWRTRVVTAAEVRERLVAELGPLTLTAGPPGAGPANSYRLGNSKGTIGFVSAISEHFCDRCNRLRLTADGKLRPCLLSDHEIDLREALREGASKEDLQTLIARAVGAKPRAHCLAEDTRARARTMAQIGG
jgi:cyclic pyranopterin phosphate synthase